MSDNVINVLKQLVDKHGHDLINEPKRVTGMLLDLCAGQVREIKSLETVVQKGMAKDLLQHGGKNLLIQIPQMAERLHREDCLDPTYARWAVEAWVIALGFTLPVDQSLGVESGDDNDWPETEESSSSGRNQINNILLILFFFTAIIIIYNGLTSTEKKIEHIQVDQNLVQDTLRNGVNISILINELERANTILVKAQKLADISSRYQKNLDLLEKPIPELEVKLDRQMQEYQLNIAKLGDSEVVNIDSYWKFLRQNTLSSRERAVVELILTHVRENNSSDHANTKACLRSFQKKFMDFVD